MKTLNKTLFSLLFSSLFLLGISFTAGANTITEDCSSRECLLDTTKTAAEVSASGGDEFDYDFSDPFFFTDKVVIYVYGPADELLYDGTFTREEMKDSAELKSWLKKSEFLLSIDNQHYYFSKE